MNIEWRVPQVYRHINPLFQTLAMKKRSPIQACTNSTMKDCLKYSRLPRFSDKMPWRKIKNLRTGVEQDPNSSTSNKKYH